MTVPPVRALRRSAGVAALSTVASAGHLLYPAYLAAATRGRRPVPPPSPEVWPGVSVVVPAYLEQHVVGNKVDDIRRQDYPGPVQILVVADDVETCVAAQAAGAEVLYNGARVGKSEAVNRGVAAARHDVVVLTDANTRLSLDALATLVRHFDDPAVMAVAGGKTVEDGAGQGIYWRFESWLKQRESMLGTTMGIVGELTAFRRGFFFPLPTPLVGDDLWLALDFIARGGRVVFDPSAYTIEQGSPSVGVEWERRTRIVTGTLDVIWRRRDLLRPGSGVAAQLWGHKLLRSTVGPLAHATLLAYAAAAAARGNPTGRLVVAAHVVGAGGVLAVATGRSLPRPLQLPAQVLFLQAVAVGGLLRYLGGDRPALWPKIDRLVEDVMPPLTADRG